MNANIMEVCNVEFQGAVPVVKEGKELLSLAGSASVVTLGGKRYLVDLGAFQGGELADIYNQQHIEFLNNLDAVFITHAHLDHIGRLPLLHQAGFTGQIYMTRETKLVTQKMLEDSLKIQNDDFSQHKTKKILDNIKKCIKVKKLFNTIGNIKTSKEDTIKAKMELKKILGEDYDKQKVLGEIDGYLSPFGVEESLEFDFEKLEQQITQNLFTEEDIAGVMDLVVEVPYDEEFVVSEDKISYKNRNIADIDILDTLPRNLDTEHVFTLSKSEIREVSKSWKDMLEQEKNSRENHNTASVAEKRDFRNMLMKKYQQRQDYENMIKGGVELSSAERIEYRYLQDFLDEYEISNRTDITTAVNKYGKALPYTRIEIQKARNLLQRRIGKAEKATVIASVSKTAHTAGAVNVSLTFFGTIKGKLKHTINKFGDRVAEVLDIDGGATVTCGGDMGKIHENRLGRTETPIRATDFLSLETTYGDKNHISREEAKQGLLDAVTDREGRCLIATFAQQRLAEILLSLMELMLEGKLDKNTQILVDSNLGKQINTIYATENPDVYSLLIPETQKELFGREVFRYLDSQEYELLYQKPGNEIILSSSGMIAGGKIMSHLPHILSNEKNRIITAGYVAEGTLGKILVHGEGKRQVIVDGKEIAMKAKAIGLTGFSAHIGQKDILQYIRDCLDEKKLKRNATIALVHGNQGPKEILKEFIQEILVEYGREDISIIIPEFQSKYSVPDRKFLTHDCNAHDLLMKHGTGELLIPDRPKFLK